MPLSRLFLDLKGFFQGISRPVQFAGEQTLGVLPKLIHETRGSLEWATEPRIGSPTIAASRLRTRAARSWRATSCGSAASARAT
eukprot:313301-Prymnesium_polylepis.1